MDIIRADGLQFLAVFGTFFTKYDLRSQNITKWKSKRNFAILWKNGRPKATNYCPVGNDFLNILLSFLSCKKMKNGPIFP